MFQEETIIRIQQKFKKANGTSINGWKYSTEGPIDDQADTSFTSSEDSFYLQMKVKHKQAEDNCSGVQHLVTNLDYKMKPHRRRTKFLRARIDTCSNVIVMPVSVYHVMYKDPDCAKLAPSKKMEFIHIPQEDPSNRIL